MSQHGRASTDGVDFAKLYAELGVAPDCGLAAFKQAHRRRVAGLHPDRPGTGPHDTDILVALNRGYAAVLEFHRGQGRLPGAPVVGGVRGAPAGRDAMEAGSRSTAAAPAGRSTAHARLLALAILAAAALWFWLSDAGHSAPADPRPASPPRASSAPAPARVQLGMDRRTVATVLGEPVARDGDDARWMYGPSWVSFECDRLADWYSSPLRPLAVGPRTRVADDVGTAPHRRTCPPLADHGARRAQGSS